MRHRIRRRLAGDDGVTLVELMVALLVLGVILLGLAATLITSLHALLANETRVRANALANEILEDRQAMAWADIEQLAGAGSIPEEHERDGIDYTADVEITWENDPESAPGDDYLEITVSLEWSDVGRTRTVTHQAYRAPPASEIDESAALRTIRANPEIGLLRLPADPAEPAGKLDYAVIMDDDGEAEVQSIPSTHGVELTLITTAPVDGVEVAFVPRNGDPLNPQTATLEAQDAEQTEWLLDSTQTPGWRYRNGDTTFTFTIDTGEGTFTGHKVVRYVLENVEPRDGPEADPETVCVDENRLGEHDVDLVVAFRGLTVDDLVEVSGAGLDPGAEWLANHVDADEYGAGIENDGAAFAFVLEEGHQYPDEDEVTVTMSGVRGFDGATGSGEVQLELDAECAP